MNDLKVYRITGACGLVSIAVFFIEFPLYFLRGPFPAMAESFKLGDFAAKNATKTDGFASDTFDEWAVRTAGSIKGLST